jgi:hypothetical protein
MGPSLSQRERGIVCPLSLWERVGMRVRRVSEIGDVDCCHTA